ncbi:MAG TPA: histidine phosphatase family protein [Verrucomicrobiota bacterium]|nr:histidine phosphatase family protein [Verrucomicrobiota bacterium]
MSDARLILIRHAEVEERYKRVFGGRIDMNLSDTGRRQAAALADYLRHKPIDVIYASPMKRVQQTLKPYLKNGAPQPVILDGLREVDFGDWTGHEWEKIQEKFGISAYQWLQLLETGGIPNGEPLAAYRSRVEPCVRQMLDSHSGKTVAAFCHGGVIRMIFSILLDVPLSRMAAYNFDYASVSEIEWKAGRMEIQLLNYTTWRHGGPAGAL